MSDALNIAIAGLGTVGTGTLQLLDRQAELLAERAGRPLRVVAVADLDTGRDRGVVLKGIACFDDALKMVAEATPTWWWSSSVVPTASPVRSARRPWPRAVMWSPPTRRCSPITA